MNSIDGTWVSDSGRQLVINGDSMENYYQGQDGKLHKNKPGRWGDLLDKTIDKKNHCMYFVEDIVTGEDGNVCFWYRKKGKMLYLYDSIQKYNQNQPDIIFYRK